MPDVLEASSSNLETSRSPVSISAGFSRRPSLRPAHPEKHSEPPTPISPPRRTARKRAASLTTETLNLPPRIGDLDLSSASTNGLPSSDLTSEKVCLCQPDPKIPRPRNAFILYRQHYQAQVIAQHPGLANPEISKIIGEQWRDQTSEVKNDWKRLAEEEKQRHQRQYPGYRYQPRRAGRSRGVHIFSPSSTDDPLRCPKCNGRYISTPSTPLTPFTPFTPSFEGHQKERSLPSFTPTVSQSTSLDQPSSSSRLQAEASKMDTLRAPPPYQQNHRRMPHQRPQPLHTHREVDEDMDMLIPSPDQKRRRNNNDPYNRNWSSSSPVSFSSQPFSRALPLSAPGYRNSLPGPRHMLVRPGSMGPPPPQSPIVPRYQYHTRQGYDESLHLPPLQTHISPLGKSTEQRDSQALGVAAMIMTIPFMNKIRVLQKIAPPLRAPGIASPTPAIRGAVVAIEGSEQALLTEIGEFITEYLNKDPFCAVQTWTGPIPFMETASSSADTAMTEDEHSSKSPSKFGSMKDPFVEYLSVISSWHTKSQEIAKYIITPVTKQDSPPIDPTLDSNTVEPKYQKPKILPVALLPAGFSLTTSDDFAKRVPINDEYAPVDHWQWMATLWRGIIGPDVTIYTTRAEKSEIETVGTVQVNRDYFSIILRVPETGRMDEVTARRLGFEVLEMAIKVEERQRKLLERRGVAA